MTENLSTQSYSPVPFWGNIPHGVTFRGSATAVAINSRDEIYVFNRGNHPVLVFDMDGDVVDRWPNDGRYVRPHSVRFDKDDNLYLVDDGGHFVEKRDRQGNLMLLLGKERKPADWQSGEIFNRPTDIGVHPITGELFVADGYGNSRVHRFTADGEHIQSWGESGSAPGQFSLPHGITVTADDRVLVCDRENFRIQIFNANGEFLDQWHLHRPVCITSMTGEHGERFLVGEHSPHRIQRGVRRLGCSVILLDSEGAEILKLGGELPGHEPDQFMDPHSLAVDSRGNIYVAEVCNSWVNSLDGPPPLGEWPSLRKWRLAEEASSPNAQQGLRR